MLNKNQKLMESTNDMLKWAQLFVKVINKLDFDRYDNLNQLMIAVPHVRLRNGFELDGYGTGCLKYGYLKLYARSKSPSRRYTPVNLNEMDKANGAANFEQMKKWPAHTDKDIIPFVEGQFIHNIIPLWASKTVPNISKYLEISFTPEAILEAVLLTEASALYMENEWLESPYLGELVIDDAHAPKVTMDSEDCALVEYYYRTKLEGTIRANVMVIQEDNGLFIETFRKDPIKTEPANQQVHEGG